MTEHVLGGRLSPDEMFPARDPRFRARYVSVRVRGVPLRLRVIECGDARAADTVVCVHGWACSVYSYRVLMPMLAARGMRTIAMDLPGAGLSDKPDDPSLYTIDAQVESVIATMDAIGVERALLVGHSMGAPISARLAVVAPERVRGLVLLAPAGFGEETVLRIASAITPRVIAPALPFLARRWLFALVLGFAYGRIYRPTARDVDEYWAPSRYPAFIRAMWDLLHHFDWNAGGHGDFERITVPAAVLDGSDDHFIVRYWVARWARVLPHAAIERIAGCGHGVAEEAPQAVVDAVMALLR
ncbi:MAG TPA: alpha/beta hydrolase [Candidatus Elarobacter sp.]|nr:alpha/beta hydrolase [Candidatus Elarobacter sp.]